MSLGWGLTLRLKKNFFYLSVSSTLNVNNTFSFSIGLGVYQVAIRIADIDLIGVEGGGLLAGGKTMNYNLSPHLRYT